MILLLHISIALSSLAYTTYLLFQPSNRKLLVSYGLIAGTIASGTYLTITAPSHILEACVMGLLYTAITLFGTVRVRRTLVVQRARDNQQR